VALRDAMAVAVVFLSVALVLALSTEEAAPTGLRDVMTGLCAFAIGVQNGVVPRLGVPDLTTTVMTRTLVGLWGGFGGSKEVTVRQLSSVISLLIGAAAGATLVTEVGRSAGLGLATTLSAGVAFLCARNTARPLAWR
jgi:uncharacterized membrane protein YoaK (UPF0700 family)